MVGDFPSFNCPLGDVSLESKFSVEPYAEPSECGLLPVLWGSSDRVNSEFIADYALWCIAAGFLGQMDHLKLFWCKEDLVLCALG
jgi:hypothetical protein